MIRKLTVILLVGTICVLGVTSAWAAKYNEAPMLRVKVAAGELPPVEERLPEEPQVVEVVEEIGQYGGTLYGVHTNPAGFEGWMVAGKEGILRIAPDYKTIIGNIAKSYEISEDGKILTLHLVKGIKWSDGVPFTADDILFWWEDVYLNDELNPVRAKWWYPGDELMEIKKIDDYTIQLNSAVPNPVVTFPIAHWWGMDGAFYLPKHWLEQFHPRYTPKEKLEKLAKEEGFDHWYELFLDKKEVDYMRRDPGMPTINPYVLKERKVGNVLLERNPYYWKVDPEGNQLPYIDRMYYKLVSDKEMVSMEIISGNVDYEALHTILEDYPLFVENAEAGNYRVLLWNANLSGTVYFMVNMTHKDPVLRNIFRDRRFRIALSLALNRQEINETLFFGKATVSQLTVPPSSVYYEEEFSKAYAEYDPQKANRLLDEMGLDKRDKAGYRLRPDGKRLTIVHEFWPGHAQAPVSEMAKEYWEDIGIQIVLKPEERSLWATRMQANEHDMTGWILDGMSDTFIMLYPNKVLPTDPVGSAFGIEWAHWYTTDGEKGEEPPAEVKRNFDLFKKMRLAGEKERIRLGKELFRSQAENLWTIGTMISTPMPIIVRNNLRNVPKELEYGFDWLFTIITHPEQFFFKK